MGTALSKAMSKAEVATTLSGEKLKKVLDDTGLSLHELTIMQKNSPTDFRKLATSLNITSTELGNMVNAGNDLQNFSEIAGMTADEFSKAWEEDAVGALMKFIQGLGDTSNASENAITMLSEMGITEVRLRDSLVRAANASGLFNEAIDKSNTAWAENTALMTESERRYATVESQLAMTKNELVKTGIAVYDKFRGPLVEALDAARTSIKNFGKQLESKEMTEAIETIAKGTGNFVKKLVELASKVIPKVLSGLAGLIKNWDKIKPLVVGATTAFVAHKVATTKLNASMTVGNALIKAGSTVWGVLTGKIKLATVAQNLFKKAQAATPWGIATIAIGALAAGVTYLIKEKNKLSDATKKELEEIKKEKEVVDEIAEARREEAEAIRERKEAEEEAISGGLGEMEYYEDLWEELKRITDENGNIQDGYETRAQFIVDTLNEALGTEMNLIDGVIDKYKDQEKEIDALIEKKKALVIFEAKEDSWKEAIKNKDTADTKLREAEVKKDEAETKMSGYEDDIEKTTREIEALREIKKVYESNSMYWDAWKTGSQIRDAKKRLKELKNLKEEYQGTYDSSIQAYNDALNNFDTYASQVAEYEYLNELMINKEYDKVATWYSGKITEASKTNGEKLVSAIQDQETGIERLEELIDKAIKDGELYKVDTYKKSIQVAKEEMQRLIKGLIEQTPTSVKKMTPEMKKAWKTLATESTSTYIETIDDLPDWQRFVIQKATGVLGTEGWNISEEWAKIARDSLTKYTGNTYEFVDAGNGMVQMVVDGVNVGKPQLLTTMETLTNDIIAKVAAGQISAEEAAKLLVDATDKGVANEEKQEKVKKTTSSLIGTLVQLFKDSKDDVKEATESMLEGGDEGLNNQTWWTKIKNSVTNLGNSMSGWLRSALQINSPSKVTKKIAEGFMEGIGLGITKNEDPILNEIGTFANEMTSTLQSSLGNIRANVNGTVSLGADTSTLNEIGQIQSNGGKTVIINQTNNSPKALSRLEIWRQTNNAAQLAARN